MKEMQSVRFPGRNPAHGPIVIAVVVPPSGVLLDVAGPCDVFNRASTIELDGKAPSAPRYELHIVAGSENGKVAWTSGAFLSCAETLSSFKTRADTILVTGSSAALEPKQGDPIVEWFRCHAPEARRVASVCGGAFFLAEAGLLDSRHATTHWRLCRELARRYPSVKVESDPIYVRDGKVSTSAGVSAGIDLALALVEEDYGAALALAVARTLVVYLRRPGGQDQFSAALKRQTALDSPIGKVQAWIGEHLDEDLGVDSLAAIAVMSPRNFARAFVRETETTPARYVEELRLGESRRMLEETDETVDAIAGICGFGSTDSLQRLFIKRLNVTPRDYRARFRRTTA
jgi:transcriptional regulator GlxA family with amidase domain